jgi:drug/metabolite transporter (DMT)-like permease
MALPRLTAEDVQSSITAPALPAGGSAALGLGFSMLAYFLFASSDAIVKLLVQRYSVFQLIPFQVCFALIPVLGTMLATGGLRAPRRKNLRLLAVRALLAGVGTVIGIYAFSQLPMADVYAIAFCTPLLVTLLSIPILGERVGLRRWSAVVVGFVGVLVMVRPGFTTLAMGHLAALATAFTGAGTVLLMRHLRGAESPSVMVASVMVGLLTVSLPVLPFVFLMPTASDLALSAASGLMMGCAQFCILRALSLASAATVAPMQYSMMVWAVVYGLVVFGQPVSPFVLAGAAIVVLSSLYTMNRERTLARMARASAQTRSS